MTALPALAVAALVVAAVAAAALAAASAARQLIAAAGFRARARRAAALRSQPAVEVRGTTSLDRRSARDASPAVRLARLAGLLAADEQAVPRPRALLFGLVTLAGILLSARAGVPVVVAVVPGLMLATGMFRWRQSRASAAVSRAFEMQLPDAIGLMVRCVRAGVPVAESIAEAGAEMPAPAGPLFAAADRKIRLGRPLEAALWDMAAAVRIAEFNFLCVAVAVQRETGGNLGETLAELEATVRKRLALRLKVRALTSEARASAFIIGALPLLMAGGLALFAPDYLAPLVETGPGRVLLGTAIGSLLIGAGIMSHLVHRESGPA